VTRHHGVTVALVGVDGAGKSTLLARLQSSYPRPIRAVKISVHGGPTSADRRAVGWTIRTVRAIRILLRARWYAAHGDVVVWDRHPIEDSIAGPDGRRVLGKRRAWLIRVAPRPDLVILLDAPVAVIAGRRPDEDVAELSERRKEFTDLAGRYPSMHVDATMTPERIDERVIQVIRSLDPWTPGAQDGGSA
jgi:thymidylate kinase